MISVSRLTKEFNQGDTCIKVLENLDFKVSSGESVAVLGQSGSGKSTLLSLLAGLDRPTSGTIEIAGKSITSMSENEMTQFRAKHIGIVFQHFHLMTHLTAIENIALPLEITGAKDYTQQALKLLDLVGLASRKNHFPRQLSGGESQRVAIARALIQKPSLLLADEPSGSLDSKTGRQIIDLFFTLIRENKMTTILVTHSEELARLCDRQMYLASGNFRVV